MKLRSLALNQFKRFTTPMRLDGIDDGLNVVVGPNEMGKSTLLDALRAALFEKHGSKAQPITALQNDRNQAGPVVELEFEMDDGVYRITKRFVKKPYARLACPDGRTLEGDAAEDALRSLLGFDDPGKTGAKPETLGMWNVLWVQQGHSFGALDLPETARSSLHSALESEVGTVLGGRRGRALPQAIEKQLAELVTSNRKPRGTYKDEIEHHDALLTEIAEFRTRRAGLSQTLDELEEAQATLSRVSSGDQDQADQQELVSARKRHTDLSSLEAHIQTAAIELKLKTRNLEQAGQAKKARQKLRDDIKVDEQAVKAAKDRMFEVSAEETEARNKYEAFQEAIRAAEAAVSEADTAIAFKRRILTAVERGARVRALQDQHNKALDAEKRQHEAQRAAAAIFVTDKALVRIRTAVKEFDSITGRLSAAATTIGFDMTADSLAGIEVGGKLLTGERPTLHVVEPTKILIPGRGGITIDPAIGDRAKLITQQRNAEANLQSALVEAGVTSFGDAEQQYAERQQLLQVVQLARQEVTLHAPATDDYESGAQSLADFVEGMRKVLARENDELGLQELPAKQEAQAALTEGEEHAEKARHALDTARAQLSGPGEVLDRLRNELAIVNARHEEGDARLKKLREECKNAEQEWPDDQLQAAIDTALIAVSQQEQAISDLEARRTDETLPQLTARIERLEKAIRDRRQKRENLKVTIARFNSHIEALEGVGLDEAIERKDREREISSQKCNRLEHEVAILTLLLSTLRTAEHEAKELYLSPVLRRLRPYLQLLFPGADIAIDENLHITGVVRDVGYQEAFHHLSMGTQEQIAVLVRLAFAEMLVEQGHPATVILDDALVFSDDRRINRMFDILNMAARNVQVIVFTCREQLFEGLGGQQLSLQAGNIEELVSA